MEFPEGSLQTSSKEPPKASPFQLPLIQLTFFKSSCTLLLSGSSFKVESNQGLVEVLGTVFNIKDRADNYIVSCTEGKVSVTLKDQNNPYILTAGHYIEVVKGELINRAEQGADRMNSWTNGISTFKNTSLIEVLQELERQYDVQINSKNIDTSVKISCNFRHDNIEVAMKSVTLPLGLTYTIKDNQISIQ